MSHNIATINGAHAVMVAGAKPWHKLGVNVPECKSWAETIRLANLDWNVEKAQLEYLGKPVDAYGIFRTENGNPVFLGAVGDRYEPIQNAYMGEFLDAILAADEGSHYESAGALGNGERVWAMARLPHDFQVVPGDKHETFLLFCSSHDGSLAATCKIVTVRVVCQNTLSAALNGNGAWMKVKHTKNADERLEAARKIMTSTVHSIQDIGNKFKLLSQRKMTRETTVAVLDKLFPKPKDERQSTTRRDNILSDILRLYESNDRNAFPEIRGTAYNLLNSFTEYTDHFRTARVTDRTAPTPDAYQRVMSRYRAPSDDEIEARRIESSLFGSGETLKQNALDIILETTNGAETIQTIYSKPSTSLLDSILDSQN